MTAHTKDEDLQELMRKMERQQRDLEYAADAANRLAAQALAMAYDRARDAGKDTTSIDMARDFLAGNDLVTRFMREKKAAAEEILNHETATRLDTDRAHFTLNFIAEFEKYTGLEV